MPLRLIIQSEMEEHEADVSVVDVYDIASEIGKECEKLIDHYGVDSITSLMPKVINALELLERLATKNERENTTVQELRSRISQLENDKIGRAENRQRFEKELEQIEEHWREESKDLMGMVTRLQDENQRLAASLQESRTGSDDSAYAASQEVDVTVLQRLRTMIDQQRDQIRARDRELSQKALEIENLSGQVEKMGVVGRELRRKQRQAQMQARGLVEERADFLAQLQDQNRELINLRARLGLARKENEDLVKLSPTPDYANKAIYDLDDPDRPRFTTAELKEILHERNELKARVSDLEDELDLYCPKPETTDDEKDAPVQGPLPYEPDDAPWKKSTESGNAVDRGERFDSYYDEALQQPNELNDLNRWTLPLHHMIIRKSQISPSFRLRFGRRSNPNPSSHILAARNIANELKTPTEPKSRDERLFSDGEVSDSKSLDVNYELIKLKNKVGSQFDDSMVDGVVVDEDSIHSHLPQIIEEEKRLVHDAICTARNFVTDGRILHGGEATAVSCALACAANVGKIGGSEQDALRSFADVLEAIPTILAENTDLSQVDGLTKATASQLVESNQRLDIDCPDRGTVGMKMQNIIESFKSKQQHILLGIELLRTIL